ncbi:hypothetical protein ScalyP_jg11689 [Parmales sp. scaly parma]|nr:hypothetical protein ScalyP_jg11689 [Parmales sp. scaly parma]
MQTDILTMWEKSEAKGYPENGAYVHGLYMEGARRNADGCGVETVSGTEVCITSASKIAFCSMVWSMPNFSPVQLVHSSSSFSSSSSFPFFFPPPFAFSFASST